MSLFSRGETISQFTKAKLFVHLGIAWLILGFGLTNTSEAQFRDASEVDTTPAARAAVVADGPAGRTELIRAIMPALHDPAFENALWGIHVIDLNTGAPIFSRNARNSMIPASNTKLYTTAAALDILGPDFRYETTLYAMGEVEDGILRGNLVVEGSGDPSISGRFTDGDQTFLFRAWADSLKSRGIYRIEGDIIGDDSVFDDVPLGRSWSWDYTTYWYAAEMGGLSFNENCVDAEIIGTRVGEPAIINIEPIGTSYVQIINETMTVHADSSRRTRYNRPWLTNSITIGNHVPEGDTITYSLSVANPALFFVHVMREVFEQEGIEVVGQLYDRTGVPLVDGYRKNGMKVGTYYSPPLEDIIYILNKRSQNLFAENLLKTLGAVDVMSQRMLDRLFSKSDVDGSFIESIDVEGSIRFNRLNRLPITDEPYLASARDGFRAARPVFEDAGIDMNRLQLADGSGMSRVNIVSPVMTTQILQYMWNHPDEAVRYAFINSLPRGGEEIGTLRNMFVRGPASYSVAAKTGTLGNARALSGYVMAADGTPLAFAIMVNHHTSGNVRANRVIEHVVNTLATYRKE